MNATVLFDTPQREISSRINSKLLACQNASIVAGFLTPSGARALAAPIRARPTLLNNLVIGSSTYPGFQAIDDLLATGVPPQVVRIHLGHTRESDTRKHGPEICCDEDAGDFVPLVALDFDLAAHW